MGKATVKRLVGIFRPVIRSSEGKRKRTPQPACNVLLPLAVTACSSRRVLHPTRERNTIGLLLGFLHRFFRAGRWHRRVIGRHHRCIVGRSGLLGGRYGRPEEFGAMAGGGGGGGGASFFAHAARPNDAAKTKLRNSAHNLRIFNAPFLS